MNMTDGTWTPLTDDDARGGAEEECKCLTGPYHGPRLRHGQSASTLIPWDLSWHPVFDDGIRADIPSLMTRAVLGLGFMLPCAGTTPGTVLLSIRFQKRRLTRTCAVLCKLVETVKT